MTFHLWTNHFEANKTHFDHIDWQNETVSQDEITLITPSIQQFQRGEDSDGKHLLKRVEVYSKKHAVAGYPQAMQFFIEEEQGHAGALEKFMNLHEIPKVKSHWVDRVFRQFRRITGIKLTTMALQSAEIIATAYYQALANASSSIVLTEVCNQILRDEQEHLKFQNHIFATFLRNSSGFYRRLFKLTHKIILYAAILVVWKEHSRLFKAGGFSFRGFRKHCLGVFQYQYALLRCSSLEIWVAEAMELFMRDKSDLKISD